MSRRRSPSSAGDVAAIGPLAGSPERIEPRGDGAARGTTFGGLCEFSGLGWGADYGSVVSWVASQSSIAPTGRGSRRCRVGTTAGAFALSTASARQANRRGSRPGCANSRPRKTLGCAQLRHPSRRCWSVGGGEVLCACRRVVGRRSPLSVACWRARPSVLCGGVGLRRFGARDLPVGRGHRVCSVWPGWLVARSGIRLVLSASWRCR